MSRFKSKKELVDDILKERELLKALLKEIPDSKKKVVITDGMSVKDFLAHRAEWGAMMIRWYTEAKKNKKPDVPTKEYKWNQLKELNAAVHKKYKSKSLADVERYFNRTHNKLFKLIERTTEKELFTKNHLNFTGSSDLATYVNSATAAHYRSARRIIQKWWKKQTAST